MTACVQLFLTGQSQFGFVTQFLFLSFKTQ